MAKDYFEIVGKTRTETLSCYLSVLMDENGGRDLTGMDITLAVLQDIKKIKAKE